MFRKMENPTKPPRSIFPNISIYQNFLDHDSWAILDQYVRNTDENSWGFTTPMTDRPPSPVRFRTVEHSKDPSIKYLRSHVFTDEYFQKLITGEVSEPFPDGLENYDDWNLVLHNPIDKKILDIIEKLDRKIEQTIFSLFRQKARNTFPAVFTKIANQRSMRMHVDGYDFDERNDNKNAPCHFASIYYLNSDYDGGEHYTPYLGLNYKPTANSMILNCVPWDEDMAHCVKQVTKGARYVRQHFWILDKD